jgi:hypothetical protein
MTRPSACVAKINTSVSGTQVQELGGCSGSGRGAYIPVWQHPVVSLQACVPLGPVGGDRNRCPQRSNPSLGRTVRFANSMSLRTCPLLDVTSGREQVGMVLQKTCLRLCLTSDQVRRAKFAMSDTTKRTIKTQKRILAPSIATPATPPNPMAAAMSATTRKMMA